MMKKIVTITVCFMLCFLCLFSNDAQATNPIELVVNSNQISSDVSRW